LFFMATSEHSRHFWRDKHASFLKAIPT